MILVFAAGIQLIVNVNLVLLILEKLVGPLLGRF